jgi:two-component system CheB/CheR fusion protein
MPVIEIEQGMRIEPDHVYIVPPRMQLLTEDETFILRAEPRLDGWPKTINVLLRSMAASLGPRLVAVILSGMDADGAAALSVVKAAGGVTFTQADAQYDSMPKNARATGCVDYVMSAREIAQALNDLGNGTLGRLHPRIRQVS